MFMAHGGPPMLTSVWCIKLHGLKYSIVLFVTLAAKAQGGTQCNCLNLKVSVLVAAVQNSNSVSSTLCKLSCL
jgi:hypothetical protein